MSKKPLFVGAIASVIAINSVFADTTVTSKTYVDTTRQATIPAADTNYEANGGGVSVVTYTENAGVLGERFICDADAEDNGYCNDDNLVTRDLLGEQMDDFGNYFSEQIQQVTNLPETTVTYKTCYQEVNGDCILWNLTDKNVYGRCHSDTDCTWLDCSNNPHEPYYQCGNNGQCECGAGR